MKKEQIIELNGGLAHSGIRYKQAINNKHGMFEGILSSEPRKVAKTFLYVYDRTEKRIHLKKITMENWMRYTIKWEPDHQRVMELRKVAMMELVEKIEKYKKKFGWKPMGAMFSTGS